MVKFLPPTRQQLAKVANGDNELLRALEALFNQAGITLPDNITDMVAAIDANARNIQAATEAADLALARMNSILTMADDVSNAADRALIDANSAFSSANSVMDKAQEVLHVADRALIDANSALALANVVFSNVAYGGFRNAVQGVAGANVTSTWTKVVTYNEQNITPVNTMFDTVNHEFRIYRAGVYVFYMEASFLHNSEPNEQRILGLRLRNLDTGLISRALYVGTGQKQTATSVSATPIVSITDATLNTRWIVEVAQVDAGQPNYTTVTVANSAISVVRIADL